MTRIILISFLFVISFNSFSKEREQITNRSSLDELSEYYTINVGGNLLNKYTENYLILSSKSGVKPKFSLELSYSLNFDEENVVNLVDSYGINKKFSKVGPGKWSYSGMNIIYDNGFYILNSYGKWKYVFSSTGILKSFSKNSLINYEYEYNCCGYILSKNGQILYRFVEQDGVKNYYFENGDTYHLYYQNDNIVTFDFKNGEKYSSFSFLYDEYGTLKSVKEGNFNIFSTTIKGLDIFGYEILDAKDNTSPILFEKWTNGVTFSTNLDGKYYLSYKNTRLSFKSNTYFTSIDFLRYKFNYKETQLKNYEKSNGYVESHFNKDENLDFSLIRKQDNSVFLNIYTYNNKIKANIIEKFNGYKNEFLKYEKWNGDFLSEMAYGDSLFIFGSNNKILKITSSAFIKDKFERAINGGEILSQNISYNKDMIYRPQIAPAIAAAEACASSPYCVAAVMITGKYLYDSVVVTINMLMNYWDEEGRGDRCRREWAEARDMCEELIYCPLANDGVTGGYLDINECAAGLVSEDCDGGPIE